MVTGEASRMRRLLAFVMSFVLVLTLVPSSRIVLADEQVGEDQIGLNAQDTDTESGSQAPDGDGKTDNKTGDVSLPEIPLDGEKTDGNTSSDVPSDGKKTDGETVDGSNDIKLPDVPLDGDKTDDGSGDTKTPEVPVDDKKESEGETEDGKGNTDKKTKVDEILASMTLDEKISQLIVVAARAWNETNVTDLSAVPALAQALQKHQYGGVILFGQNIVETEQTARLVDALQKNNAKVDASTNIPYLMAVDEEGGVVVRFGMGTRTCGNMAIGATGLAALRYAESTGRILGSESAALGFNVDFAPSIDVNNNPANPAIGTRSFSDDPERVADLGVRFSSGLSSERVIATYKHFPGHGDTDADTHIDVASVNKNHDQLVKCELVPFKKAIESGARMIMTAHVTLPNYDDPYTFASGAVGYLPATMSHKVITSLLREELGYEGVVITDALEMDAVEKAGVVPGAEGSVEARANIAEMCLNAGVDLLLIPKDLIDESSVTFYDEYIDALKAKVESGAISQDRIDESVRRVLELKKDYGILDLDTTSSDIDAKVEKAKQVVGSAAHHATELEIARKALTMLKNDGETLPIEGHDVNVVLVGRDSGDVAGFTYALKNLQSEGLLDKDAQIVNKVAGTTTGEDSAKTKIFLDYYYDSAKTAVHVTDDLLNAIKDADVVVSITKTWGLATLQPTHAQYQAMSQLIAKTHEAGGKFVMISGNLPYDAARYQEADAILCAYMSTGLDVDPTERQAGSATMGAYNANIFAAIGSLFDNMPPTGSLPVEIPNMKVEGETVAFDLGNVLYKRGTGFTYNYRFIQGAGGSHTYGSGANLFFKNNSRYDLLDSVSVDGKQLNESDYEAAWGSCALTLKSAYLDTLADGEHTLETVHNYNGYGVGVAHVQTNFTTAGTPQPTEPTPGTSGGTGNGTRTTTVTTPVSTGRGTTTTTSTKPVSTTTTNTTTTTAKTGDSMVSLGIIALIAAAGAAVIAFALIKRRSK